MIRNGCESIQMKESINQRGVHTGMATNSHWNLTMLHDAAELGTSIDGMELEWKLPCFYSQYYGSKYLMNIHFYPDQTT